MKLRQNQCTIHISITMPHLFGTMPHIFGTMLHIFGTMPHIFGTMPHIFGTMSHIFGTMPHIFGTMSHIFSTLLHIFGTMLHILGTLPHIFGTIPHIFGTIPHIFSTMQQLPNIPGVKKNSRLNQKKNYFDPPLLGRRRRPQAEVLREHDILQFYFSYFFVLMWKPPELYKHVLMGLKHNCVNFKNYCDLFL